MLSIYEFHDSLLESVEQNGDRVSIQLRAVRSDIEEGKTQPAEYLRQEIRLLCEEAELSVDSPNLPSWLLEGSFRAGQSDAADADAGVAGTLPASLRSAQEVELVLAGLHEGSGDFVTIRVQAKSLTLQTLSEPESMQYTRAAQ